jgi:photosystem II stability/assembly factor-like uncharacterized protein
MLKCYEFRALHDRPTRQSIRLVTLAADFGVGAHEMELGIMNIGRRGVMKRVAKWLGKGQRDMGRIRRRMKWEAVATLVVLVTVVLGGCGGDDENGAVSAWNWIPQVSGTEYSLNDVWALDENHAWAVGASGTILFYDGTAWREDPQSRQITQELLWSVFALDENHVWAVGWNALVLFYDGSSWSIQHYEPNSEHDLFTVTAVDADHVWAGAIAGRYLFYDGTSWEWQLTGTDYDLRGMFALDMNNIWGVGGIILFNNGTSWSIQKQDTDLTKIDGVRRDQVWAVGNNGSVLFYDGSAWNEQETGVEGYLRDISAKNSALVFAVGDDGQIIRFDGSGWTKQDSGTKQHLWGVSFIDDRSVWVVGEGGIILLGIRI